jgi:hypothetical protein
MDATIAIHIGFQTEAFLICFPFLTWQTKIWTQWAAHFPVDPKGKGDPISNSHFKKSDVQIDIDSS